MRPLFLSLILKPVVILRCSTTSVAAAQRIAPASLQLASLPVLGYPVCRRNFTCGPPGKQVLGTIMADLGKESEEKVLNGAGEGGGGVECVKESKILEGREGREEALKEKPALPKLSAAEFRVYNSMAEHMEYFHNHFRQSWTIIHSSCVNNKRPPGLSLKQFIATGLQLCSHLSAHHSIEEQHIFPVLATKMPEFKQGRNAAELLRQHKEIHKGMDGFEDYLRRCRSGETSLEMGVLREQMDSWGEVLWKHLDQEVKTLGAENMRRYWTLEEMKRMPM